MNRGAKPGMNMTWLRTVTARLKGLFGRSARENELEEELRAHLDALTEENLRRGMTPGEARYAARREFGGVEQIKQLYREQRGLPFLDTLLQDLRFALRTMAKRPGFAAVAILTLALGIGATTAVFSVVDRILFRSLPYPHDERLVSFGLLAPIERNEFMLGASYVDFRKEPGPFEAVTSMVPGTADCDVTEENPVRLNCGLVEQTFLLTLGVQPILGRNFTLEEDRPNAPRVALLAYSIWKSRFGGDPGILRKTISLDGSATQIVGVLPSSFEMPTLRSADILLPQALDEEQQRKSAPGAVLRTFARLRPRINVPQAIAGLQPWFEQALQGAPAEFRKEIHLSVRTLRDRQVQDVRAVSWILLGSVFAVLLVACTNVANLLLARATGRERELAVRAALGASRARLMRQALTESLLLGLLGGVTGCWIAALLLRVFVSIAPEGIPRLPQANLDLRVVVFTFGVALASALIFGVAPALNRPTPEVLSGKQTSSPTRSLVRQMLVSAQIAISLILLAAAGLLLRSLWNLENAPTGIDAQKVLTETIALADYRYPNAAKQIAFFTELERRLKRLPGVSAVALSDSLPPGGQMRSTIFAAIEVAGRPLLAEGTGGMVGWRAVTPDYFSALTIPIVQGRGFRQEDRLPSENSIILSETMARALLPNENPIGKRLRLFRTQGPWRTVVGVVADVKNNGLAAGSDPEFYLPWKNDPVVSFSGASLILRTRMNPNSVSAWMRGETAGLDPALPVKIETMSERVGRLADGPRFNAVLLSLFAGTGMFLAAIGIYGVVGFLVAQQTREIGVRMALGATPGSVLKMVLSNVARWTIGGAALGLVGAWFGTRLLESLLFEVRAHDPFLLGSALCVLLAVAFLAAWIPARRAMRVDPMVALRYE
jgi:putative ABC transport system permease protein